MLVFNFLSSFFENPSFLPPGAQDNLSRGDFDSKFFGGPGDSHQSILDEIDEFQPLLGGRFGTWYEILWYLRWVSFNLAAIIRNNITTHRLSLLLQHIPVLTGNYQAWGGRFSGGNERCDCILGLRTVLESLPCIGNINFYQNLDVEKGKQMMRFQCEIDQGIPTAMQVSQMFQNGTRIQMERYVTLFKKCNFYIKTQTPITYPTHPARPQSYSHIQKIFFPSYYPCPVRFIAIINRTARLILLMSEQVGAHLQLPSSYNFHRQTTNHTRAHSIDAQKFHLWTRNDMYRSSYAHYHSPDSSSPRSGHLPGYGGFIPSNRAESLHAATYTNMTKSALNSPGLNVNPGHLSSTGRNLNPQALIDTSKAASSHKYGKTEIQTPHPAWVPQEWSSTTKAAYISPDQYSVPTQRDTDKHLQTTKMKTKQSGFQRDRAYWDGNGWKPNPILNPACLTSEYRERFNPEMDYHRKVEKDSLPQLKRPEYKYKFNK